MLVCSWPPIEHHANPQITPLRRQRMVSFLVAGMAEAGIHLVVALSSSFRVWRRSSSSFPIEVGKSRRYTDRRVGLSVGMLFIALCLSLTGWVHRNTKYAAPPTRVAGNHATGSTQPYFGNPV